ncbi:elongation factor G [Planctomyces sp. SH-PL62]|uniref:elongation factor G n=1 Tax=Planctomyces sp. SH-PL62 TaxID=1636152 RepID=UPI00078CF3F6|nr:elongation factor G [Planctomyces sp. SH-PL62]AMV39157.1 Elongation factor G [Planctomyces sp. SH-PL62]
MTTAYHVADIRNIALAGHGASGKTSLADALLFTAGAITRKGSVDEGTSTLDYDEEEKRRHFTIDCNLGHLVWNDKQVHLLDSPGYPDFIGNALSALAAAENVVLAVSGPAGIEVNTRRLFHEARKMGLGRFIAVTKMDADNVDYRSDLEAIRETFGPACVPFNVPIGQGPSFAGLVDVLQSHDEDPAECPVPPTEAYQMVVEQIVESDEALMNRYLEGEEIGVEELRKAAHDAIAAGKLVPVLCVCTKKDLGLKELLDLLTTCGLSPEDVHRFGTRGDEADATEEEILPVEDGTLVAQVFKTSNDQFMGKLSFLRILAGKITPDTTLVNLRSGKTAKAGHVYVVQGKAQEEVPEAIAGDLVAIAKFEDLHVSDTVSNIGGNTSVARLQASPIHFPAPMVPRAVVPKAREDEAKISAGLTKIADEDPTFTVRRDAQTHELVISGMSDLHLDVIQQRLKNRYKLEMSTHIPHVPYLETISAPAEADHRHKKQTGGRGQFAEVHLRVRPVERGQGFVFTDAVKGGVIPNQYIPAVEKGVRERLDKGVISGNQVVDVEVEVYFGKDHPVDSSEQAFKTAAAYAFRKAFEKAYPVLLEPIVAVEVTSPSTFFGDLSADMSTRRGHILGMEAQAGGLQSIQAVVPLAEMLSYASTLKSMTSGQGSFTMEMRGYEPVPPNVQQQIVDRYQKSRTGVEEE